MQISSIHHFYAYEDGDTITPRMGISIDDGFGLSQYWDVNAQAVSSTKFRDHPATLYPQPFSSRSGKFVVPQSGTWHYNNPESDALTFDANGVCNTPGLIGVFKQSTIIANNATWPCLVIQRELASAADHTDKYIYYRGKYNGKDFTVQQLIPIQTSVGDAFDILISITGADGSGDNVLSNDNDWVKMTPHLQLSGISIASGVTYKWQQLVNGSWVDITSTGGMYEIGQDSSLTLYNAAVEGVDNFRCAATYKTIIYYKVQEVSDVHDPYYIDDGASTAGDAVAEGVTVSLTPAVYDRSSGQKDTAHSWTYNFTVTKNPTGDTVSTTSGSKFSFTYDNLVSWGGGINIRIEAEAQS